MVRGTIRKSGNRFLFESNGALWRIYFLGRMQGNFVIWEEERFDRWKVTKDNVHFDHILYRQELDNIPPSAPAAASK